MSEQLFTTRELYAIADSIGKGYGPSRCPVAIDTPEKLEFWKSLKQEIKEIEASGGVFFVPWDLD